MLRLAGTVVSADVKNGNKNNLIIDWEFNEDVEQEMILKPHNSSHMHRASMVKSPQNIS